MAKKETVIFIVGPTAVGKTAFAIELAKRIKGEIISSDSMQAYRSMDIISQKPTKRERKIIPQYLIDILSPKEEYSAAEFTKRAGLLIDDIIKRKRRPIVVGGSGLYTKTLIDGLFFSPEKDGAFRKDLESKAEEGGSKFLHAELEKVDPEAASKIHPNDLRRIIRALEVFHLTGTPISEHKKKTRGIKDRFNIRIYGLIRERSVIYERIEDRVERMFEAGLVKEVKRIKRCAPSITAEASLGYKEVLGFLDKRYSAQEAMELLKKKTRHFAKKQLTWFRPDKRIRWINLKIPQGKAVDIVIRDLQK